MDIVDGAQTSMTGGDRYMPADRSEEPPTMPLTSAQIERFKQLEHAASIFYTCPNPDQRDNAHRFLLEFRAEAAADVGSLPALLNLIETSASNDAVVFACATLREVIQLNWDKVQPAQCNYLRDALLKCLFNFVSSSRPNYVVTGLIRAISSIVKTAWKSYYPDNRSVLSLTAPLTDSSGSTRAHACAALQLLNNIIVDVQPDIGTFDHLQRAMTILFKDQQLEKILQLGLSALQSTLTPEELAVKAHDHSRMALMESALKLILACLQYDFPATGYAPIQSLNQPLLVPSDWKFLKNEDTILLIFKVLQTPAPRGDSINLAIQCLSWLVTLKRSMFASAGDRRAFLKVFMDGVTSVLTGPSQTAFLSDSDNCMHLSRLIDSMRSTFPFSDFILAENAFDSWMMAVYGFTCNAIRQNLSCKQCLIDTWAAIIASSGKQSATLQSHPNPLSLPGRVQRVLELSLNVATTYVDAEFAVAEFPNGEEDDFPELDISEGAAGLSIPSSLKSIATIIRPNAYNFATFALTRFNEVVQRSSNAQGIVFGPFRVLVDMVTCLITNRSNSSVGTLMTESALAQQNQIEAQLCGRVFDLIKQTDVLPASSAHLEISFLLFLTEIHRLITSDGPSPECSANISLLETLVQFVSSAVEAPGMNDGGEAHDSPLQKLSITLLDIMVMKVSRNLSVWSSSSLPGSHVVIGASLALLDSLAYGVRIRFSSSHPLVPSLYCIPKVYSNGRILLQSPFVRHLLHSAESDTSEQKWPFLSLPAFRKHRTAFYTTVSRLFFLQDDYLIESNWDAFTSSIMRGANHIKNILGQTPGQPLNSLIIGWLSDLRGLFHATNRSFTYNLALEWFIPDFLNLLVQIAIQYAADFRLMYHVIRLLAEILDNSTKRMQFDRSDSTPFELFQGCAKIIGLFASSQGTIKVHAPQIDLDDDDADYNDDDEDVGNSSSTLHDEQKWSKYRCLIQSMLTFRRILAGQFVNFGILQLYNDTSVGAIHSILHTALSIPSSDLGCYPKLEETVYPFIEAYCVQFVVEFLHFDDVKFFALLNLFKYALVNSNSLKPHAIACVFNSVATITGHLVHVRYGAGGAHISSVDKKTVDTHITVRQDQYIQFLNLAIECVLQATHLDKWSIAGPIFNLLILYPQETISTILTQFKSHFTVENDPQIIENAFASMIDSVFSSPLSNSSKPGATNSLFFFDNEFTFLIDEESFLNASGSEDSPHSPVMDQERITPEDNTPPEQKINELREIIRRTKGRVIGSVRTKFVDRFANFYRRFRLSI